MHFEAYVASFIPLDSSKVFTPFISPIVPIDIRSSCSSISELYFLTMCATSLKLCSIIIFFALRSPFLYLIKHNFSSSGDNAGGKEPEFLMCRAKKKNPFASISARSLIIISPH